jgi:hypothetical protein
LWKGVRARGNSHFQRAVLAGAFVGSIGLLMHALLDFHFRIPATALTFLILYALGLVVAQSSVSARPS